MIATGASVGGRPTDERRSIGICTARGDEEHRRRDDGGDHTSERHRNPVYPHENSLKDR